MLMTSKHQVVVAVITAITIAIVLFIGPLRQFASYFLWTLLCLAWSGWIIVKRFKETDEVEAQALLFSFAYGGIVGVAISMVSVMLALGVPAIGGLITQLAYSPERAGMEAIFGFGLGVVFTTIIVSLSILAGWRVWWTKRS